jgi:hypothetical protein
MKITRRQEEFINKLHDLNQELEGPIHYSILAESLGVSPFTAYDMLCLLEQKGLVTSEYQLASDKCGPGRAERVFYLTQATQQRKKDIIQRELGEHPDSEKVRQLVLRRLHEGGVPEQDMVEEMLARIPANGQGQARYCLEVMTILALRLRECSGMKTVLEYLPDILPSDDPGGRASLCSLASFAAGVLAQECSPDPEWMIELMAHIRQYTQIVMQMDAAEWRQLGQTLATAFASLSE